MQLEEDLKFKTNSNKVDRCLILGMIWCGVALQGLITQEVISSALHKSNPIQFHCIWSPPSTPISRNPSFRKHGNPPKFLRKLMSSFLSRAELNRYPRTGAGGYWRHSSAKFIGVRTLIVLMEPSILDCFYAL